MDSIIGNIYSTSYGSKKFLGFSSDAFEEDLKGELLKLNSDGLFNEEIQLSVKLALKRE
ncbi:hypothetical protein M4D55_04570 [Metabacillus idriensis]|uniref:Uncharacterized protein n=1 Tax=Metabacillus idriensis TaxID=324768 RepID=A0A6I2M5Y3_9BACI|nr:hypothetical protein [Metabacillus idriensis]MCM3595056.1 hypothetical protein [Metabacillus idriensis]MRX52917.1 hypothetical protein [Metabacillus idriensis]